MTAMLCAIDLGESGRGVVAWAAHAAQQAGASLHVLHVLPSLGALPVAAGYVHEERLEGLRLDEARAALTALLGEQHFASVEVRIGSPETEIIARADEIGASSIVIGAPRKSLVPILGSSGARLLRLSARPVLTVPASARVRAVRRVLVPTDLGASADAALGEAMETVRALFLAPDGPALDVHLLHVLDLPEYVVRQEVLATELERSVKNELHALARRHREGGHAVHETIALGIAADVIAARAESFDVDVVAMPSHGRQGMARFFLGSVAEKVARAAVRPTLTFHPAAMRAR